MLRKLSQTFVVVMLFASCWLTYFILLAANLPLLQKVFKMVSSDGGWLTILHHKSGPQLIGMCVGMVLAGNVAWLVSKVFEKRFVEIWARPRPFV